MAELSGTTIMWRGIMFSGSADGTPFGIRTLEGWEDRPDTRRDSDARPQAHGRFDGPTWSDERIVTLGGQYADRVNRDALLLTLSEAMTWDSRLGVTEDLVITKAGRTLTAQAQLTVYRPDTTTHWASGVVPYAIEWRCPDPLRYADPVSYPTTFPVLRGGLEYDLYTDGAGVDTGFLEYGAASDTGRITVTNPGTADAPLTFQVIGPVDAAGFDIAQIDSDLRLRFAGPVGAGAVLVLDGATGNVLLDGVSDRGGQLTYRDWPVVPAGGSVELAFIPLGPTSDARLTAVVRPGSW